MKEFSHEYAEHWYYNPTPLQKSGGLWPIRAGRNMAKSHYKMGPRMITYFSIHFVLEGEGYFKQNNINTPIQTGDIFCLFPNQTHLYKTNSENKLKMFWFAFDGKQANPIVNRIGLSEYSSHVKGIVTDEIITIIKELSDHMQNMGDHDDLQSISMIYKLFHHLSIRAKELNISSASATDWLQRSKEYMNMHFAENISVTDVSEYIGLNRSHFTTSFTEKTGQTPSRYILHLKMNKALELLAEQAYTITEMALTLGYSDLYSFSRAFKNYFGISPNQYLDEQWRR
ncbi:AraC family transcriptional regulator [Gracilibacillus salitolerans]|uniref:AraC family transcriptional regulator n=1 Tax=Gracilibacillus salitolerans TaxID=2663022 RepID=A0A5Q2TFV6_9BACI|nr:AraC family transcriptional regulator [Gracilibacillus salitolerans]QGH33536.1 AraC family transcriptional regulator [Gracilibacillus salitolerans]